MSSSPSKTALPGDLRSKPAWLKVPLAGGDVHGRLKRLTRELSLNTVCEEARCPNLGECWSGEHATMTIMVLGRQCTRRCRFCAVETVERAAPPDPAEPANVGRAVGRLNLDYVVITSVDRDDLSDGGAGHYSRCVAEIRQRAPQTIIETLAPDYQGPDLARLLPGRGATGPGAHPDVFAHNVEVVPRLQRKVRDPRCSFERSLRTLREAKQRDGALLTKSSLMVGLSESADEISEGMGLLRRRFYSRVLGAYPSDIMRCKDGFVSVVPGAPDFATSFGLLIDKPELIDDPLLQLPKERVVRWRDFDALIGPWLMDHEAEEIVTKAQELRLAFAFVPDVADLSEDEHLAARGFFDDIDGEKSVGAPVKLSETPLRTAPAPNLGEGDAELLSSAKGGSS